MEYIQKKMFVDENLRPVAEETETPKPTKSSGATTFIAWEGFKWMLKMVLYVSLIVICLIGLEELRNDPAKYIVIAKSLLSDFTRYMTTTF